MRGFSQPLRDCTVTLVLEIDNPTLLIEKQRNLESNVQGVRPLVQVIKAVRLISVQTAWREPLGLLSAGLGEPTTQK